MWGGIAPQMKCHFIADINNKTKLYMSCTSASILYYLAIMVQQICSLSFFFFFFLAIDNWFVNHHSISHVFRTYDYSPKCNTNFLYLLCDVSISTRNGHVFSSRQKYPENVIKIHDYILSGQAKLIYYPKLRACANDLYRHIATTFLLNSWKYRLRK